MKALRLNGWGIEASVMKMRMQELGLPVWRVVQPFPDWEAETAARLPEAEAVLAYSTGALLLLSRPELLAKARRTAFFAPILGFLAEWDLGGRTRRGQVAYLRRWLRRDPQSALADFHRRAGLTGKPSDRLAEERLEELDGGLVQLQERRVPPERLRGREAYMGYGDTLLDAERMAALVPGLVAAPGAGHDAGSILATTGFRL